MNLTCENCNHPVRPLFQTHDFNRRVSSQSFTYAKCDACGLIFLENVPQDLGAYYPPSYYPLPATEAALRISLHTEEYKIELTRRFSRGGRLIEIGPGTGGYALLAKDAGFDVQVIEMSTESCRFIERQLGIRAVNTENEVAALQESAQADVIALWHVIEHLRNPFELITTAIQKLNPGGILILAAPNPLAWQFKVLGRYWTHVDAPRHVRLIPMSLIAAIAREAGLEPLLQTTTDKGSLGWNAFGWDYSLGNLPKNRLSKRIAHAIGRQLAKLLRPLESAEGRGSAYTVIYRRPI
jgi:2-polyprenyl-3-methyl-5-hydroxy-6-metoxy-1,4-benzoquinol methylase